MKELRCRGDLPDLFTHFLYISVGQFPIPTNFPPCIFFLSFWPIMISFRLLLWLLTVHFHSQCRTFMALHSGFRRPPTYPHIYALSHLLPFACSLPPESTNSLSKQKNNHTCIYLPKGKIIIYRRRRGKAIKLQQTVPLKSNNFVCFPLQWIFQIRHVVGQIVCIVLYCCIFRQILRLYNMYIIDSPDLVSLRWVCCKEKLFPTHKSSQIIL